MKTSVQFMFRDGRLAMREIELIHRPDLATVHDGVGIYVYPDGAFLQVPTNNGMLRSHFSLHGNPLDARMGRRTGVIYIEDE